MKKEIIKIESKDQWLELRSHDITSTDCAVLFGLSPYKTIYELWHEKKSGQIISIDENQRMKWGSRLESAIAQGVAEDLNLTIEPFKDYHRLKEIKAGSSFDFHIPDKNALLEIKNVDSLVYRNNWTEEEAPPHIELQVQHQLLVSGYESAYLCALVGGNDLKLIKRKKDAYIQKQIIQRIKNFWEMSEPQPNFEKDASFIISLNQLAEPNKVYEGDTTDLQNLAIIYKSISDQIKELENKKQAIKAQCLSIIGDSEKVKSDKFSISAGLIAPSEVSFTRAGYRDFKIYLKKDK